MATDIPNLHVVVGGGTRSEAAPGYNLIPAIGIKRIARRFDLGAAKHGAENWKNSCWFEHHAYVWCVEAYNHMQEHMLKMVAGTDPTDDHLGAIGWGVTVIAWCEERYGKPWTEFTRVAVDPGLKA